MSKTVRRDVLRRKVQQGMMEAETRNGEWIPAIFNDGEFVHGLMSLRARDFKSGVGRAWENPDGSITLYIHSNSSVRLREITKWNK